MKLFSIVSIFLFTLTISVSTAYNVLPVTVLTNQIDNIEDVKRLFTAETMLVYALENLTQRECGRCFSNNIQYQNFCLRLSLKQRVSFLDHYRC